MSHKIGPSPPLCHHHYHYNQHHHVSGPLLNVGRITACVQDFLKLIVRSPVPPRMPKVSLLSSVHLHSSQLLSLLSGTMPFSTLLSKPLWSLTWSEFFRFWKSCSFWVCFLHCSTTAECQYFSTYWTVKWKQYIFLRMWSGFSRTKKQLAIELTTHLML